MKKFKLIIVALCLSFVCFLSACSKPAQIDVEAKVKTGDESMYVTTTAQAVTEYLANEEVETSIDGWRMTMRMKMKGENGTIVSDTYINAIVINGENGPEIALKLKTTTTEENDTQTTEQTMYLNNDILYMIIDPAMTDQLNIANNKIKIQISQGEELDNEFMDITEAYDFDFVLDMINSGLIQEGIEISSYTDGNMHRIKLHRDEENTLGTDETFYQTMYAVFNNDTIDSAKMEGNSPFMYLSLSLEKFSGSIEYPDPDDFFEISSDLFGSLLM